MQVRAHNNALADFEAKKKNRNTFLHVCSNEKTCNLSFVLLQSTLNWWPNCALDFLLRSQLVNSHQSHIVMSSDSSCSTNSQSWSSSGSSGGSTRCSDESAEASRAGGSPCFASSSVHALSWCCPSTGATGVFAMDVDERCNDAPPHFFPLTPPRDDGSSGGEHSRTPSPPPQSPPRLPARAALPLRSRCAACRRKLGLMPFACACGGVFCVRHQTGLAAHLYGSALPDASRGGHLCQFDYVEAHRQRLQRQMRRTAAQGRAAHGMRDTV